MRNGMADVLCETSSMVSFKNRLPNSFPNPCIIPTEHHKVYDSPRVHVKPKGSHTKFRCLRHTFKPRRQNPTRLVFILWVWLKIKQEGQTAGFGPCFFTSQTKPCWNSGFLNSPQPYFSDSWVICMTLRDARFLRVLRRLAGLGLRPYPGRDRGRRVGGGDGGHVRPFQLRE